MKEKAEGKQILNEQYPRTFTYDSVYGEESTNLDMFNGNFRKVIAAVTEGYNATIFAYGQTGSGKTYSMTGVPGNLGVIPNSFQFLFDYIPQHPDVQFLLKASYLEIYNEQVKDLLTNVTGLQIKESKDKGVYVNNLKEITCSSQDELQNVLDQGSLHRATAATKMNATSSRSHSIFIVRVEQCERVDGRDQYKKGMLNLVDLAGSERQSKTGATGQTLKEACSINLSLSTLGVVIQKLAEGCDYIPYRESSLTRLLQTSLGGNSKTLMMAAINPASTNYSETLSTLRFADQVKKIKNKPVVNMDPKDLQIKELKEKIAKLEAQLAMALQSGKLTLQQQQQAQSVINQMKREAGQKVIEEVQEEIEEITEIDDPTAKEEIDKLKKQKENMKATVENQKEQELQAQKLIDEMKEQIESLKRSVVVGTKLDAAKEKERELRETKAKLAEKEERELLLKRQLAQKQQLIEQKNKVWSSAKQEAEGLQKIVEQKKQEIQVIQQDIQSYQDEMNQRMKDITDQSNDISKQTYLLQYIINKFIPQQEVKQIEQQCIWNEQKDKYVIGSKQIVIDVLQKARDVKVVLPRGNVVAKMVNEQKKEEQQQIQQTQPKPPEPRKLKKAAKPKLKVEVTSESVSTSLPSLNSKTSQYKNRNVW